MVEDIFPIIITEKDFVEKFNELYKKNEQNRPYNMNILDELHANENAHTRILIKLLSFSENGEYPIFKKFISVLNKELENGFQISEFDKPLIKGQYADIDAYIYKEDKSISIIIENKIQWAKDQDKQLERYIKSSEYHGVEKENIYAVYLTDDGRKKISDYSLTDDAKKALGMDEAKEINGRFIELNYKNHLLPFLKDILTYLDFSKEIYLKSAIVQYIDYLEGRFGLREREMAYTESMVKGISAILQIKDEDTDTMPKKETLFREIQDYQRKLIKYDNDSYKNAEPYLTALCNSIYPDGMKPSIVIKNLIFHFADKDGNIKPEFKEVIPFSRLKIRWDLIRQNINKIWFVIDNIQDAFVIEMTSKEIKFTNNYKRINQNSLKQLLEKHNIMSSSKENEFEMSYEENYQTINDKITELFKDMKNKRLFS